MAIEGMKRAAHPDVAIPPGEYLLEEIEARGMTREELAERTGNSVDAIDEIVTGRKAVTAEMALRLEETMPEIPARFWLNLEMDYQHTKAQLRRNKAK